MKRTKKVAAKSPFDVSLGGGEFDELFVSNAYVHIERMNETGFWIGIEVPGAPRVCVNTGVYRGVWFFNLSEDKIGGFKHSIQRPRKSKPVKPATTNPTPASGDGRQV